MLITPKEEQNGHISEREKFLTLLDARFQVQQAQINLLRQTGGLERWLKVLLAESPAATATGTTQP